MFSAGEISASITKAAQAAADKVGTATKYQPNPCSFYLLNLGIDTTIGIPILILILKVLSVGASYTALANPPESIKSGHYGDPPRATWWLKQSIIYFFGLMGMKTCVFFIFQLLPWIGIVGDWALKWTEGNEAVQIAFVMFIFPLIMNGMQYYIIDIFIKQRPEPEVDAEGRDGNESERGLLARDSDDRDHSIDEEEAVKDTAGSGKASVQSRTKEAYDARSDRGGGRGTGESSSPASNAEDAAARHGPGA